MMKDVCKKARNQPTILLLRPIIKVMLFEISNPYNVGANLFNER